MEMRKFLYIAVGAAMFTPPPPKKKAHFHILGSSKFLTSLPHSFTDIGSNDLELDRRE